MNYKDDFPLLKQQRSGHPLVYLDSGATAQKAESVIDAVTDYLTTTYANPHRGAYLISQKATDLYEGVREKVRRFIGAEKLSEVIFVKSSTEALNLIARSYGETHLSAGDEIVISIAEHHANLIPWQRAAMKTGAVLKYMYIDEEGALPDEELAKITEKTRIVALTHVSNVTGHVNDIKKIAAIAHAHGAVMISDGSQAVPTCRWMSGTWMWTFIPSQVIRSWP